MSATPLDGARLARDLRESLKAEVEWFRHQTGVVPRLEVLLIGDDPASKVYVGTKTKTCQQVGMVGGLTTVPANVGLAEVLDRLDGWNADPSVHGILVQLPLPNHLAEATLFDRVAPLKDVDGFHPDNAGRLALGRPRFVPCTPLGIQRLLTAHGIAVRGRRALVLGRSNIVGKPMAQLLTNKGDGGDATVTVAHSLSRDIDQLAREADLLIVAMGRVKAVKADWIKPGAVVVDVGIHRLADGTLCGDVDFESVQAVAGALTPVPGGVGPMTVAMLLENTLKAARLAVAEVQS